MSRWQRTINLADVWETENVQLIAKTISERLKSIQSLGVEYIDRERLSLAEEFADIAQDQSAGTDDFDNVMQCLYDWADQPLDDTVLNGKKVCWIAVR